MFKEDQRELLTHERARAILRKAWKEMAFVRLLILFLFLLAATLIVSLLSLLFPSYGIVYVLAGVAGLALIGLNVYYLVSEYLWIQNGDFRIEEDQVVSVSGYEVNADKMLLRTLSDFLANLAFLVIRDYGKTSAVYLDFRVFGKVAVDSKKKNRAESGDMFFLLVYNQGNRVRKILSANTYRIQ